MLRRHHYRTSWPYETRLLEDASARLADWRAAAAGRGTGEQPLEAVRAALDDDLDTPRALGALDRAAAQGLDVTAAAELLGVDLSDSPQ